ncbi:unnamed protein product [Rotaria sordida]|uniref:MAM domain-containing protein n=1 Tax=Rotaria sordida TaxID=392033 RepID=A0A819VAK3_9BILA|nr:unnamed protein product [Rotaria sordida]
MMFKFVAIFAIGLLIVLHINSPKINSTVHVILSNEQSVIQDTRQQIGFANAPLISSSKILTDEDVLPKSIPEQTMKASNVQEMTSTIIITERAFGPLFRCDFDSACFADDQIRRTNGSEFDPLPPPSGLEPPRAPTSDVTSITALTSNNETCRLPYQLSLDNNMNPTYPYMRFCYNNTCETDNGDIATCASGLYGLVSLNLSDSPTIISHSFNYNSTPGDSVGEQCLRFYYYFTIYNGQDWKQQIDVLIRPDNDAGRGFLIGNLTILDMEENGWQLQYITFNSTFSNYTARSFSFIVGIENRTVNSTLNRTIHFALDNIELYDFNCAYVNDQLNPTTPPTVVTSPSGK